MSVHQIAEPHAHTPRIHIHVQALRLCQLDSPHDARVAIAPAVVFGLVFQPCTRLTPFETGAGVLAVVGFRYRSARLVATGRVDFAGDDTHVGLGGQACSLCVDGQMIVEEGRRVVVVLIKGGPYCAFLA